MNCEKCGEEMWDNRQGKRNPKAPDFKCKDKECNGAIWLNDKNGKPKAKSNNGGSAPAKDKDSPEQHLMRVSNLYNRCIVAGERVREEREITDEQFQAMVSAFFIESSRAGYVDMMPDTRPAGEKERQRREVPHVGPETSNWDATDEVPF